jgi:hypothetical protein
MMSGHASILTHEGKRNKSFEGIDGYPDFTQRISRRDSQLNFLFMITFQRTTARM